ncbi:class I SAM-dependent methyltransferase [Pseudomonas syringae]|uniref:Methyltransferase n=1 Tax=Pseudomonas syringae TaxID=317 RepID=A0A085VNX9_PSESX|nr:class I SAM-dependent methyltransferase [Pseudomonas syringae]KFE57142.1 methyltransferase [Pseudomonas syringae]
MSDTWNEGYFTDVGYTYGYYREINPVFQRYCLLLRGLASAESANASHCELGFGQGVSINIHAAANASHYVGTDFNPAHAAHANSLAASYSGDNRLYDDSFEQLLAREDLPQFDSISLHGIWTWISRDNHKLIAEFARRQLKPGGVLYISYNCFPGWSPSAPLRQLFTLHDRFASAAKTGTARVDAALQFSEALLTANPLYTQAVPNLDAKLKTIQGQNRQYVAHEYFNRDWNCMYFTDVVDALAPGKLEFATTATPFDTVDAINLGAEAQTFLLGIDHPIMREQARDYFVNQQFRKDLYVRGATRLSAAEQRDRMLNTRVVLLQMSDSVASKVTGALGEATLQQEIYAPLLEALSAKANAPKTLRQLATAAPGMNYAVLSQAIAILIGMGAVAPCQSEAAEKQVQNRCNALNQHLCLQAQFEKRVEFLASPVTGGGVMVSRFEQLFLLSIKQGKKQPAEWAQQVWQLLAGQGERLVTEGKILETPEENLAELTRQAEAFAEKSLVVLKALRIA